MKKIIIGISATCFLLLCIFLIAFMAVFIPVSDSYESHVITLPPGSSRVAIASTLEQEGIIRNALLFRIAAQLAYPSQTMKAGEYELSPSQSFIEITQLLFRGVPKKELTITIVEGWTIDDIASFLESKGMFSAEEFRQAARANYEYDFLPPQDLTYERYRLEGYLYPDTYRIFTKSIPADVINKMLTNFEEKVIRIYGGQIKASGRPLHEIITLASILEREVQSDADRARVADLLLRRLKSGMPLQVDSTINYITGKSTPSASYDDIAIDSPYNTYRVRGLPPGPINNPGESSIHAALYPQANSSLFFLTTDDRKVIYSATFEEHKKNRTRYLNK